ncbi:2-hydroxyacyl-CoA lyase 2-like [Ischnura elegans]|uniref:2-hydroxyacyl-CoA lyase 2-like n=1 Tax=Ischnura elegans TaxID=197161 RepID=UPI001ED8B1D7|nr:2-hydroxyacyl-CoA lyase 2-like [Ischnura elegans]
MNMDAITTVEGMWAIFMSIAILMIVAYGVNIVKMISEIRKVDPLGKSHGGEIVAQVLEAHGVSHIFTLVGGHISPILAAAEKIGIRVVDTRHEASAVFAADAAARLSGKIGVAAVTAGPGLTNTVTAVKNAQMAESPVLLIGGAAATLLKGKGALQDIDQISLFKSVCKCCVTVKYVKDIVPVLRKAINIAMSGVPGPVFVEFPIDVLYPYYVVRQEMLGKQSTTSIFSLILHWYLEYYLARLFASAWVPRKMDPLPVSTPLSDESLVKKVAELLSKSQCPVFVVGSQAMLIPKEVTSLQKALIQMGVPTYLGGMARGLLGAESNVQFRHGRKEALKNADFILLAGAVCDFRLSYGKSFPRKAKIVTVNRDKKRATLNAGTFWSPTLTVVGDVAHFLISLEKYMHDYQCNASWISKLKEKEAMKDDDNFKLSKEISGQYLNPLQVLYELEKVLPENSILIADGGDFVATAAYILRPRGPYQWLDPGAFGTLGVGGGFAIGAKVTCPNTQVWIIYGDGSCGYSIAEFDTFMRHRLPVIALVGNDAGWTQIEREQKPLFGSSVACELEYTDYHVVACGYGAEGVVCNNQELTPAKAYSAAQDVYKSDKSMLINALIGRSDFRKGSLSV